MSRMFPGVTTWNPVTGCLHGCTYCYARSLIEGRLRNLPKYADGFTPQVHLGELERTFKQGKVFVSSMGDLFGRWVDSAVITRILKQAARSPRAELLFLTKNPARYTEFRELFRPNMVRGVTLETNRSAGFASIYSSALPPTIRVAAMPSGNKSLRTFVSIEPIMEFDMAEFVQMIRMLHPTFVYVGYDNHNHHLPEPSLEKTRLLMKELAKFTEVIPKTLREAWFERS